MYVTLNERINDFIPAYNIYSRALGALGRSPIGNMGNQRKPMNSFPVVIMANGIARGRVRTTATESHKMAAIVQLIVKKREIQPWFIASFLDTGHQCYGQLTPVKTEFSLTSVT